MEGELNERRGLYVSYNEEKNGPFEEAVRISNDFGCVTWFDSWPLDPKQLEYPTRVIVRLAGQERYFLGTLLATTRADTLNDDFEAGERNHRPSTWHGKDFKSALFISRLREVSRPREVEGQAPPQHPVYVPLLPPTMQELGIARLSVEDRLALAQEIWDSIAADIERAPLPEAQRQELERRLADSLARPDAVAPWEAVKARALGRSRQ
jgi:putative addiction module component (TIGR02574 family)